jgi:hypothetical protein
MKILINSFGTRGDIQPYIALARGLKEAGYDVAICTSEGYKEDIEKYQIQYLFMKNEMLELSQHLLETNSMGERISTAKKIGAEVRAVMDDEWTAAETFQPDLLIYHPKCLGSYHVAEKLGITAIMSIPLPFFTPTREFAVPFIASDLGFLNRFSFRAIITASNAGYGYLTLVVSLGDLLVRIQKADKEPLDYDILVKSESGVILESIADADPKVLKLRERALGMLKRFGRHEFLDVTAVMV